MATALWSNLPYLQAGNDADINARDLARAQYQDYLNRYKPVEDQLLSAARQPAAQTVGLAKGLAAQSFDTAAAARGRLNSRYGMKSLASANRLDKLAKAAMVSKAGYDTARQVRDINLDQLGKVVALGKGLATQSGDTLMQAAQNKVARDNAEAQMDAQAEAARMQTLGGLASAAIMAAALLPK